MLFGMNIVIGSGCFFQMCGLFVIVVYVIGLWWMKLFDSFLMCVLYMRLMVFFLISGVSVLFGSFIIWILIFGQVVENFFSIDGSSDDVQLFGMLIMILLVIFGCIMVVYVLLCSVSICLVNFSSILFLCVSMMLCGLCMNSGWLIVFFRFLICMFMVDCEWFMVLVVWVMLLVFVMVMMVVSML